MGLGSEISCLGFGVLGLGFALLGRGSRFRGRASRVGGWGSRFCAEFSKPRPPGWHLGPGFAIWRRNLEAQTRSCLGFAILYPKLRSPAQRRRNSTPKGAGAALKHEHFVYFCDLLVFLRVFSRMAQEGSRREGGRGEGKPSPQLGALNTSDHYRGSTDFGAIWGPSWGPSWGQVGMKIRKMEAPRRCQKMCCKKLVRVYATVFPCTQAGGGVLPIINQSNTPRTTPRAL